MSKPELVSGTVALGDGELEIPGYFGEILDNLGAYASYPCLAVYAQRIAQDLFRVANPAVVRWDLPVELRAPGKSINYNCLGFAPAARISAEQVAFLNSAGVSLDRFYFDNLELPVINQLIVSV